MVLATQRNILKIAGFQSSCDAVVWPHGSGIGVQHAAVFVLKSIEGKVIQVTLFRRAIENSLYLLSKKVISVV